MTNGPHASNEATLIVRRADLLGPVLGRVVGMLAARAHCPIDRLDEALLLTDAVAAHAPAHSDGEVTIHVRTAVEGLWMRIGPLADGRAQALIEASALPGIGNVFERVADDVRADDSELHLHLAFRD